MTDRTTDILGPAPFRVTVLMGDDRQRAYAADATGAVPGPGVQVVTPLADAVLSTTYRVTAADLDEAAASLGVDRRWLLNTACQRDAGGFAGRLGEVARNRGLPDLPPRTREVLHALKSAVDQARALGPQAIVRAALGYLALPSGPGGPAYGRLVDHVNRVLANPGSNPRIARRFAPVTGLADIDPAGVTLWWVKEGSATIVFQVAVPLSGGRPPVRFVLNVAKDLTSAAAELRQTYADFAALFRIDPRSVMEPYGTADVPVATWRGPVHAAVLAAEWFDGHELHVYEGSSQLHVWQDQRMGRDHPIPVDVSDRIWEEVIRMRARYTRITPAGLVPIATHVNAGDYIFRERPDGEWDVLLIWTRRPAADVPPGDYIVLAGLLPGVNVFGADQGRTVWWDQPARALAALRAGLAEAGLSAGQVAGLLRAASEGVFARHADHPEALPNFPMARTADPDEFRRVFDRARTALAASLAAPGA